MPEDILDRLFGELAAAELPVPAPATVVARGRQRRRRARGLAVLTAAGVAAIVVVGVSQLPGPRPRVQSTTGHRSGSAVCTAAPDAALDAEMTHDLPLRRQPGVTPIALSADGQAMYVETTTPGFHGIAEESLATGAIFTKIARLPGSYDGAQGVLGPNGDLVWTSTYGSGGEGAQTPMQAWSPRTGMTTTLEPNRQHGGVIGAPVILNRQIAAWAEAVGRLQEIVEANLATGVIDVIARGHLGAPIFVGNALVWPVANRANGPAWHLVARNDALFPARQQIAVPQQLRAAGRATTGASNPGSWASPIGVIASNGWATAYFSQNLAELFYSPSPSRPARLVLRLHGDSTFVPGGLAIGNGYLGWTVNNDASYLASITTLAAARITTFGSVSSVGADYVVVGDAPASKTSQQRQYHLFRASTVNGLACADPPPASK